MRRPILVSLLMAAVVLIYGDQVLAYAFYETNDPPYAEISPWGYTYVLNGDSISFDAYYSDDDDGTIEDYYWSSSYSYVSPSYGYDDTYTPTFSNGPRKQYVKLTVTDDDGAYDYDYTDVYILDTFECTCTEDEVILNGSAVEVDLPYVDPSWYGVFLFKILGGSEHIEVFTDSACTNRIYDGKYWYRGGLADKVYVKGTSLSNTNEIRLQVGAGGSTNSSDVYTSEVQLTCTPEPVNVSISALANNGYLGQGRSATLSVNLSPAVSSGTVSLSIAESSAIGFRAWCQWPPQCPFWKAAYG